MASSFGVRWCEIDGLSFNGSAGTVKNFRVVCHQLFAVGDEMSGLLATVASLTSSGAIVSVGMYFIATSCGSASVGVEVSTYDFVAFISNVVEFAAAVIWADFFYLHVYV